MICYASLALFVYNILKLLTLSHVFPRVNNAELSTLKEVRFLAHIVATK